MRLYHYTSVSLCETILSDSLRQGQLWLPDGSLRRDVGWLTTDPSPEGHGLLRGDEKLSDDSVRYMTLVQGFKPPNRRTLNKMQIRIGIDLDPNVEPTLMSFTEWCSRNADMKYAKRLGLSAVMDLKGLSDHEIRQRMKTCPSKESTWWLSFYPIQPSAFCSVDFNTEAGGFVPYDFEAHGREVLRDDGFSFPSAETLASLRELVPSKTCRFEQTKASGFCRDPHAPPYVVIRGGGQQQLFEIESGKLVVSSGNRGAGDSPALQAWIRSHYDELMNCWRQAVELYYVAYPQSRAA